jgi:predicted ATPase
VDVSSPSPLVGRAAERETLARAIDGLVAGRSAIVVVEGEPGIGKSALLAELTRSAREAGCAVRGARASEFEADLPYLIWREALDVQLERADRHGVHAALRGALAELAATDPLVLCLDDVHWADPASLDALAALVRRPPAGPILLALASREGQVPAPLAAALGTERATRMMLRPLTQAEAIELVGETASDIYARAGGNPFYLEQLARAREAAIDGPVPTTVAAALAAELTRLTDDARRLLDAAAIAGDPFEAGLAAAVAELSDAAALAALDELLVLALVRPTGTPRRFVPPSSRSPRGVCRESRRLAAGRARACGGRAAAQRRRAGRARASRRAGRRPRRRGGDRPAGRSGRRAAVPGSRGGGALPRRGAAPAARRGRASRSASARRWAACRRPSRCRGPVRCAGDAARGPADGAGRAVPGTHGRAGQFGVVAWPD